MTARFATPADDELLTSIVMHPDVHVTNGNGPFDPTAYTAHPKSFAVIVEGGCFLADALEQGAYGIHTNFLPSARGANALHECADALRLAFTATPAEALYTKVLGSRGVTLFAQAMGFRNTFKSPGGTQFMRMDIDDWIVKDYANEVQGQIFHEALGELATHAEDYVHDRFVGAAWLMLAGLQYEKAERVYGRWARHAGYQPFRFISAEPPRIDIGTAVLTLRPEHGDFTIED